MITWADVLKIAPELSGKLPTTTTAQIVEDVLFLLVESSWGRLYDLACKYLIAHIATQIARGAFGPSGAVIGESVGGISRQYAANSPMGTHSDFDQTPYGKRYKALLLALPGRIGMVC
jgi:hypothetical protein